ncbi:hypothetical protein P9C77_gp50 [Bacillus phage J5a]|uniref:Uncharacterized protein n=1 Tax=Bacillus phage J5a TaxID=2767195 RepID=A0A7S6NIZ0_9CAUD|nr:hypothetical protein [Bacillus paranthracis]YP_010739946.1 hypothetical protein P9C77_gp50 [Bacillus phage J5a]MCC2432621.1 hypothetical protein [Bacillus paranthracis]QOQ37228.1 hypothetical protein J5a_050 [Bacillus phage J5a]
MKEIEELKDRLRNEMVTRMDDSDIVDILTVLQRVEEEIDDWKQSHDKVARALEKSERDHKETMDLLHDTSKSQVQRIEVAELILNLFEVGKKYKIITFDTDYGYTEQKCFVKGKTEERLLLDIYEPFETKGCWIHWTELDAIKEIE